MERDTRGVPRDDEGTVIDDFVGAVVDLLTVFIFGTELAIGGEKVRMQVRYRAPAWVLHVGDPTGG